MNMRRCLARLDDVMLDCEFPLTLRDKIIDVVEKHYTEDTNTEKSDDEIH